MVTSLQSVKLLSARYLLRAIKDNTTDQSQSDDSSSRNALLQRYGIDTSSTQTSSTLSKLLGTLSATTDGTATETEADKTAISSDIKTSSFMAGLKKKLEAMADAGGGDTQAEAMLSALKAGTLVVTDPVQGETITAWDVDAASEKNTTSKAGTKTENSTWSDFLKSHLARTSHGTYEKSTDGSHVDKITSNNAYFGTIGSDYAYLSWPQEKA